MRTPGATGCFGVALPGVTCERPPNSFFQKLISVTPCRTSESAIHVDASFLFSFRQLVEYCSRLIPHGPNFAFDISRTRVETTKPLVFFVCLFLLYYLHPNLAKRFCRDKKEIAVCSKTGKSPRTECGFLCVHFRIYGHTVNAKSPDIRWEGHVRAIQSAHGNRRRHQVNHRYQTGRFFPRFCPSLRI